MTYSLDKIQGEYQLDAITRVDGRDVPQPVVRTRDQDAFAAALCLLFNGGGPDWARRVAADVGRHRAR